MINQANAPVPVNTEKQLNQKVLHKKNLILDEIHLKSIMWTVHIFELKSVCMPPNDQCFNFI